jgi:hypothetical protein
MKRVPFGRNTKIFQRDANLQAISCNSASHKKHLAKLDKLEVLEVLDILKLVASGWVIWRGKCTFRQKTCIENRESLASSANASFLSKHCKNCFDRRAHAMCR